MEVLSQAPQPTIKCYHSIKNGVAAQILYQEFTPTSSYTAGRNLQSYNFEDSLDNFGGSFSFTVKEDISKDIMQKTFMDEVQPLDIIVISESGSEARIDFIGVVTTVSIGGIASNLNKSVTVSGKSIEWLFLYYNINTDIKACIFQNTEANKVFITDLANRQGTSPLTVDDIAESCYVMFKDRTEKNKEISNFTIGGIIEKWYGSDIFDAISESFLYPISSNLFNTGKINIIDYLGKILPKPIYEIYGFINSFNKPKIKIRKVPFDKPIAKYSINPTQLTDFTLTRSCEEVYTAFMPYIEGSKQSPDFFMTLQAAENASDSKDSGKEPGYNSALPNNEKVRLYGYQLLTCSFIGYTPDEKTNGETIDNDKLNALARDMEKWYSNLDDMYNGDFTIVNMTKEKPARIGEWVSFAGGLFYVTTEKHSWNYGDNPMINYQVSRGGKYVGGIFTKLKNLSAAYREFE